MSLAMLCAQRLPAFRAGIKDKYLLQIHDHVSSGSWPDAIAGHMVNVYVLGRTHHLDESCSGCEL